MPEPRPKWTEAVRMFLADDILTEERYGYPDDGSADDLLEEIEAAVYGILCRTYGHDIIDDQCGIPEHRFCIYCGRREGAILGG
jgi:hypothetical protein